VASDVLGAAGGIANQPHILRRDLAVSIKPHIVGDTLAMFEALDAGSLQSADVDEDFDRPHIG
jgi:hypothetical protein